MKLHRSFFVLVLLIGLLITVLPAAAQTSFSVVCPNGARITNGVDLILNLRTANTYRVTAIGINGFDPVMAVTDANNNVIACNDDEPTAAGYNVSLPTTGVVPAASLTSQITFQTRSSTTFADFYITVGGLNGANGAFVLLVEGMSVTSGDITGTVIGDPFTVALSSNLGLSGGPVAAYLIANDTSLDPLINVVDSNENILASCDDAGTETCYGLGAAESLSAYFIADGRNRIPGGSLDAFMAITWDDVNVNPNEVTYLYFRMASFNLQTTGDYTAVFHMGIGMGSDTPATSSSSSSSSSSTLTITDLTCSTTAQQIEGAVNSVGAYRCPSDCGSGSAWGTDVYTDDSSICTAAIHAGVSRIKGGGEFLLTIVNGLSSHPGSTRNGVTTATWGAWTRSFSVSPLSR